MRQKLNMNQKPIKVFNSNWSTSHSIMCNEEIKNSSFIKQPLTLLYLLECSQQEVLSCLRTHKVLVTSELKDSINKVFNKLEVDLKEMNLDDNRSSNSHLEEKRAFEDVNESFCKAKQALNLNNRILTKNIDKINFNLTSLKKSIKITESSLDRLCIRDVRRSPSQGETIEDSTLCKKITEIQKQFAELTEGIKNMESNLKTYEQLFDKKDSTAQLLLKSYKVQTELTPQMFESQIAKKNEEIAQLKEDITELLKVTQDQHVNDSFDAINNPLLSKLCAETSTFLHIIDKLKQLVIKKDESMIEKYKIKLEQHKKTLTDLINITQSQKATSFFTENEQGVVQSKIKETASKRQSEETARYATMLSKCKEEVKMKAREIEELREELYNCKKELKKVREKPNVLKSSEDTVIRLLNKARMNFNGLYRVLEMAVEERIKNMIERIYRIKQKYDMQMNKYSKGIDIEGNSNSKILERRKDYQTVQTKRLIKDIVNTMSKRHREREQQYLRLLDDRLTQVIDIRLKLKQKINILVETINKQTNTINQLKDENNINSEKQIKLINELNTLKQTNKILNDNKSIQTFKESNEQYNSIQEIKVKYSNIINKYSININDNNKYLNKLLTTINGLIENSKKLNINYTNIKKSLQDSLRHLKENFDKLTREVNEKNYGLNLANEESKRTINELSNTISILEINNIKLKEQNDTLETKAAQQREDVEKLKSMLVIEESKGKLQSNTDKELNELKQQYNIIQDTLKEAQNKIISNDIELKHIRAELDVSRNSKAETIDTIRSSLQNDIANLKEQYTNLKTNLSEVKTTNESLIREKQLLEQDLLVRDMTIRKYELFIVTSAQKIKELKIDLKETKNAYNDFNTIISYMRNSIQKIIHNNKLKTQDNILIERNTKEIKLDNESILELEEENKKLQEQIDIERYEHNTDIDTIKNDCNDKINDLAYRFQLEFTNKDEEVNNINKKINLLTNKLKETLKNITMIKSNCKIVTNTYKEFNNDIIQYLKEKLGKLRNDINRLKINKNDHITDSRINKYIGIESDNEEIEQLKRNHVSKVKQYKEIITSLQIQLKEIHDKDISILVMHKKYYTMFKILLNDLHMLKSKIKDIPNTYKEFIVSVFKTAIDDTKKKTNSVYSSLKEEYQIRLKEQQQDYLTLQAQNKLLQEEIVISNERRKELEYEKSSLIEKYQDLKTLSKYHTMYKDKFNSYVETLNNHNNKLNHILYKSIPILESKFNRMKSERNKSSKTDLDPIESDYFNYKSNNNNREKHRAEIENDEVIELMLNSLKVINKDVSKDVSSKVIPLTQYYTSITVELWREYKTVEGCKKRLIELLGTYYEYDEIEDFPGVCESIASAFECDKTLIELNNASMQRIQKNLRIFGIKSMKVVMEKTNLLYEQFKKLQIKLRRLNPEIYERNNSLQLLLKTAKEDIDTLAEASMQEKANIIQQLNNYKEKYNDNNNCIQQANKQLLKVLKKYQSIDEKITLNELIESTASLLESMHEKGEKLENEFRQLRSKESKELDNALLDDEFVVEPASIIQHHTDPHTAPTGNLKSTFTESKEEIDSSNDWRLERKELVLKIEELEKNNETIKIKIRDLARSYGESNSRGTIEDLDNIMNKQLQAENIKDKKISKLTIELSTIEKQLNEMKTKYKTDENMINDLVIDYTKKLDKVTNDNFELQQLLDAIKNAYIDLLHEIPLGSYEDSLLDIATSLSIDTKQFNNLRKNKRSSSKK